MGEYYQTDLPIYESKGNENKMSENFYYDVLKKTISVLVVDDDPDQLDFYHEMLSGHPLFTVNKASTSRLAEEAIHSHTPHVCILDLGIDDIDNDEFYLLRKYSELLPFIIISGSTDIARAFHATKLGAVGMMAKPPEMNSPEFWGNLGELFLNRSILPVITDAINPCIGECCRILQNDFPDNVSDWAQKAGITDTYLRKLLTECYSFPPKHVLFIYKFYKDALDYFNKRYLAELDESEPSRININLSECQRQVSYFLQNRKALEAIRDKNVRSG
jgi:CheY-like chemotaxis protein